MCICGKKNCNGLCNEAIGGRIIEYIENNSDRILDTEIGTFVPITKGSKDYYLVIGSQFYSLDTRVSSTKIMKDSSKMDRIMKENPFNCNQFDISKKIKAYTSLIDKSAYRYIKIITGLYDYKKVIIPVEPDKQVDVNIANVEGASGDAKPLFKRCKVASVRWSVDLDSVFSGVLTCQAENDKSKAYHIKVEEYGRNYVVKSLMDISNDTKLKSIICMSKFGYIKPIVLKGKKLSIIIDNTSMYKLDDRGVAEIGTWSFNNLTGLDLVTDENIKSLILRYKEYIALHRKMIMPYTIGTENIVEVSKLK